MKIKAFKLGISDLNSSICKNTDITPYEMLLGYLPQNLITQNFKNC